MSNTTPKSFGRFEAEAELGLSGANGHIFLLAECFIVMDLMVETRAAIKATFAGRTLQYMECCQARRCDWKLPSWSMMRTNSTKKGSTVARVHWPDEFAEEAVALFGFRELSDVKVIHFSWIIQTCNIIATMPSLRWLFNSALLLASIPLTSALKFDIQAHPGYESQDKERCIRNFVARDTLVVVTVTVDGKKGDGQVLNMHVRDLSRRFVFILEINAQSRSRML